MKYTARHARALQEFINCYADSDGCVMVSKWVSGRFIKQARALPPFVKRVERREYSNCELPRHGSVERIGYEFLKKNARCRAVLVLDKLKMFKFFNKNSYGKEF